jgi:hypothetical protein
LFSKARRRALFTPSGRPTAVTDDFGNCLIAEQVAILRKRLLAGGALDARALCRWKIVKPQEQPAASQKWNADQTHEDERFHVVVFDVAWIPGTTCFHAVEEGPTMLAFDCILLDQFCAKAAFLFDSEHGTSGFSLILSGKRRGPR